MIEIFIPAAAVQGNCIVRTAFDYCKVRGLRYRARFWSSWGGWMILAEPICKLDRTKGK